jgi:hypothetical protein
MISLPNNKINIRVRRRFENLFHIFYLKYKILILTPINFTIPFEHMEGIYICNVIYKKSHWKPHLIWFHSHTRHKPRILYLNRLFQYHLCWILMVDSNPQRNCIIKTFNFNIIFIMVKKLFSLFIISHSSPLLNDGLILQFIFICITFPPTWAYLVLLPLIAMVIPTHCKQITFKIVEF